MLGVGFTSVFYGISNTDPDSIIITEFAEGGSLYSYLHQSRKVVSLRRTITWALQIARGIAYLHYDAPVKTIHRDLKSRNVVLTGDGVCKLCHFGGSKNPTHTVTVTTFRGTVDLRERCNMHQVIDALNRIKGREFVSDEDMNEALRLTANDPLMIPVSSALKARKRGLKNGVTDFIRVFGCPGYNPTVWICVTVNLIPFIWIWPKPTKRIADETLEDALEQFSGCCGIERWIDYLHSQNTIANKVIEVCNRLRKGEREWGYSVWLYHYFFMNKQQQKIVREMNVELPSRYRFDDVHPNEHGR